ncbi:hypothetical protein L596_010580 [Steinernema carpocapsae]|uniref:JmjC domain-containing protein n=1 Tax=Steinernema carpocapsae TaxID=34508 RepID=A0A4U5PIW6_STECR|nr:hypothetical protein L596_010580 [Steinernema carpocapsae]
MCSKSDKTAISKRKFQFSICLLFGQSTSSSPTEEEDDMRRDWICCDVCEKWYHYSCVAIEEWEILIIDKYHCPSCVPTRGPSLQRKAANRHRYEFYRLNADHLPVQIGTPKWMDSFVPREGDFPSPPEDMIRVLEDGHKLKNFWKDDQVWKTPFKIKNKDGLGLKVPEPGFTFADVVDIMGRDRSVDTIDVYGQNTYPMSLGRFLDLYQSENRERLYNILSLEFSTCPKMSELVAPPSIVGEISWVHRFWPEVKHSAHKHLFKEGEFSEELNWVKTCNKTTQVYDPYEEHKKARPDVALFCLAGMGGSFTDFHIDFGGSSVWYNVFKGQKIFYVVEPTEENIGMYDQLQRSQLKYENFLSDQEGVTTYRVVVNEGETLLIPSGWIHAVYTPVDSLVFGGNFLHSLNIKMQIRMNFMEAEQNISVRFRYPSFELCNRYAASVILTTLRKCRKTYSHLPKHFEDGMQTLISAMRRWDKTEAKSDYAWCHPSYGNLTENLRNEFLKYKKRMRKRPPPSEPSVPVAPKPEKVKRVFLSNTINLKPVSNVVLSATPVKKTPSPVDSKSKSKSTSLMLLRLRLR